MNWSAEWRPFLLIGIVFLVCFFLPVPEVVEASRIVAPFMEALHLVQWCAREHVVLCLLPAFLIGGAIAVFISQGALLGRPGSEGLIPSEWIVSAVAGNSLRANFFARSRAR